VVGPDALGAAVQVGQAIVADPAGHRLGAGAGLGTVRADRSRGADRTSGVRLDQAGGEERAQQVLAEGERDRAGGNGVLEDPQPEERRLRVVARGGAEGGPGGHGRVAAQAGPAGRPQAGQHGIDGVVGGEQTIAQAVEVGGGEHAPTLSRRPRRTVGGSWHPGFRKEDR